MKLLIAGLLTGLIFSGCTHVKGVVVEDPSGRPLPTAVFSIGRPDGIAVYAKHHVDKNGKFDFFVFPLDEDNVYVYDGANDPRMTLQHFETAQLNEFMQVRLHTMHIEAGDPAP